jgi:hypothetical protein
MSGMVEVNGEQLRRLRVAGVVARRGLGGVLFGFWVPAWTVEIDKMSKRATETGWVLAWVANVGPGALREGDVIPRARLESVFDHGQHERLESARAAYVLNGWDGVVGLTGHRSGDLPNYNGVAPVEAERRMRRNWSRS